MGRRPPPALRARGGRCWWAPKGWDLPPGTGGHPGRARPERKWRRVISAQRMVPGTDHRNQFRWGPCSATASRSCSNSLAPWDLAPIGNWWSWCQPISLGTESCCFSTVPSASPTGCGRCPPPRRRKVATAAKAGQQFALAIHRCPLRVSEHEEAHDLPPPVARWGDPTRLASWGARRGRSRHGGASAAVRSPCAWQRPSACKRGRGRPDGAVGARPAPAAASGSGSPAQVVHRRDGVPTSWLRGVPRRCVPPPRCHPPSLAADDVLSPHPRPPRRTTRANVGRSGTWWRRGSWPFPPQACEPTYR
jgi:hypothetical protein